MKPSSEHTHQEFAQDLDLVRPSALLTKDPDHAGMLSYRYLDTGETVRVPNTHYNRTNEVVLARHEALAVLNEKKAFEIVTQRNPQLSSAARAQIAERYRENARKLRAISV